MCIRDSLAADRQPLAEIFRRDLPLRRVDAELQTRAARQMARADLLRPELQPLIRERRLAPERQDAAGRIFPRRPAGERDPGRPAAAERADAPGGRLYGLRIAVRQDMLRRQPPVRQKAQDERLFKAGPGVGPLPQADACLLYTSGRHPLYSQHIEAQFIFCNVADIREICNYLASVHY